MLSLADVRTFQIGVIGAGRIGRLHAEHLAYRIPAPTCWPVARRGGEVARRPPRCGVPRRWPTIARSRTPTQAVAICSATDTHAEIIEAAAAAGKHIFCEKPIDADLERIDRALAAVDAAGVKLQIGFNRRFDANHRRVRQAVAARQDRRAAPAAHHQPRPARRRRSSMCASRAGCSWI